MIPMQRVSAAAFVAALLMTACGGSAPGTPVTNTATKSPPSTPTAASTTTVEGIVDGKGSIVIDGVRYDDSEAVAAKDVFPAAETPATVADMRLGMQVRASVDTSGKVIKVVSVAAAIGKVEAVDVAASTLNVAGQRIKVTASGQGQTVFEGYAALADVKVADWVEVHGTLDASGNIVATRIEREDPTTMGTAVRGSGLVTALNGSAKTFTLGALTVDFSSATVLPADATLADGQTVTVFSDALPLAGRLQAKSVRIARAPQEEGRRIVIGGLVSGFKSIADFKVNGITVDASAATLSGPTSTAADVVDNALVRVEGSVAAGAAGAAPTIKATRVAVVPASEKRKVLLVGQVEAFVSLANFKVRGTTVDASTSSVVYDRGMASDVKEGTFVAVRGRVEGDVVKAERLSVETPPKDVPFRLRGTVGKVNAAAKTFTLLGIPMTLADTVTYKGGAAADLVDGKTVQVQGSFSGQAFTVTAVSFETAATAPVAFVFGTASEVTATGVNVNGQAVAIDASTRVEGGTLANGQFIDVVGRLNGTAFTATSIDIRAPIAGARLQGPVADLAAATQTFRLNGATVNYSAARFLNGDVGKLANGVNVRVSGTLADGKLMASQVQFR